MSNNKQQSATKITLIGPKSFFSVDKKSKVYCFYCKKLLLASTIGAHFSSACKKAALAKGLTQADIAAKAEDRKKKRNQNLKKKRKNFQYCFNAAVKRLKKNMRPPNPPNRLCDVKVGNPFYWDKDHELKQLQDNDLRKQLGDYMRNPIQKHITKLKNFKDDDDMLKKFARFMKLVSRDFHPDK